MRLNQHEKLKTHEGARAVRISPEEQLRRSVMSCMLWEREFYEDGVSIADRISETAKNVSKDVLGRIAIEAREQMKLRHAPLLILDSLCRRGGEGVADVVERVIQRPDEMTELLAIYWRDGRKPLPKQMQKGLGRAFLKFDEYQLAKYDRDGPVKLRDVMFLTHPKPCGAEQEELFRRVAERSLVAPDTWEVGLSGGGDKREVFERLLREKKLGYMALLRNLRGMIGAGVNRDLVAEAILARRGADRVLPFRFVAAARACPLMERELDAAMLEGLQVGGDRLKGETCVLIDVSGSMEASLSAKSDLTRMDAAAALGSIVMSDRVRLFTFSYELVEVPPRQGMAGVDAIIRSQQHRGTDLASAVEVLNANVRADRLIVVTDEQAHGGRWSRGVPQPNFRRAYMINVASYENGVGYRGGWTHLDGFSESVLRWIHRTED